MITKSITRRPWLTAAAAVAALVVALGLIFIFGSNQVASAASALFGDAALVPDGNPGGSLQLRSDASVSPGFGGATFDDATGVSFSSLAVLSADFNVTDDSCGGGSPRFQIQIDTNGDSVSDGNIFVYLGPSPSFSGCTSGWQTTGNLIDNEDAGRWDYTQLGGPLGGYSGAPVNVLAGKILNISIVVDSSWSAAATGGDSEMTTLIDNVVIGKIVETSYEFAAPPPPAPVTVTIDKYVDGVHATAGNADSSSFPMNASWSNAGFADGSGSFSLGPVGFNNPNPYEATTADMAQGANYSASEDTTGSNVGGSCADDKPFALVGYSVGDSEASAEAAGASASAPALTNLTGDKVVIVWNETCGEEPPPPPPPPPANAPRIDNNGQSVQPGGHLDFVGHNFGHEENVDMRLGGSLLRTVHADGGGNFSTGSMLAPGTPGTYNYVFTGQTSGLTATSTITVTSP